MTRPDPLPRNNRHVREFAAQHHLRTLLAEDSELVIPCGPRRAAIHLGLGLRAGRWYVCAIDLSVRQSSAILGALAGTGYRVAQCGDAEFVIDLPRDVDPLSILDRHPWTRPRRRVRRSPEAIATATARLAALRDSVARPSPRTDGTSQAENKAAGSATPPDAVVPGSASTDGGSASTEVRRPAIEGKSQDVESEGTPR